MRLQDALRKLDIFEGILAEYVCACVCVCVCVCVHVYVVYEDTNLYNNMGMT